MGDKQLTILEKKIRGKMLAIKTGATTPEESKIGKMLNELKEIDEPLFLNMIKEYKNILLKHSNK